MLLYQRKDSPHWWVKITHSQGCLQHSTGTADRRAAQEYHDTLKASLWAQQRLGTKPEHTWDEAVVRYLADTTHKASQDDDKSHLRWLDRYLRGVALQTIGRVEIDEITRARRAGGAANATVNRTLEVLRAILRKAVFVWDWLDKARRCRCCRSRSGASAGSHGRKRTGCSQNCPSISRRWRGSVSRPDCAGRT